MKFRKKPVVIEAVQWTGKNWDSIEKFAGERAQLVVKYSSDGRYLEYSRLQIDTLEGTHVASLGDWIIKGPKGEFYPCKPDIFAATYEPVEERAMTEPPNLRSAPRCGICEHVHFAKYGLCVCMKHGRGFVTVSTDVCDDYEEERDE